VVFSIFFINDISQNFDERNGRFAKDRAKLFLSEDKLIFHVFLKRLGVKRLILSGGEYTKSGTYFVFPR